MPKNRPTRTQRAARVERRVLATAMGTWRDTRRFLAARRAKKAAKAAADARAKQSRGVDRVPDRLRGLHLTVGEHTSSAVRLTPDGHIRRGGTTIRTEANLLGNHAERRARGQRGKPRRPRARELHQDHPWRAFLEESRTRGPARDTVPDLVLVDEAPEPDRPGRGA